MADPAGSTTESDNQRTRARYFSAEYGPALQMGFGIDFFALFSTSLILDGGATRWPFLVATIGHWLCIPLIVFRRPRSPTFVDLLFIRFGLFAVLAVMLVLAALLGRFA